MGGGGGCTVRRTAWVGTGAAPLSACLPPLFLAGSLEKETAENLSRGAPACGPIIPIHINMRPIATQIANDEAIAANLVRAEGT